MQGKLKRVTQWLEGWLVHLHCTHIYVTRLMKIFKMDFYLWSAY